MKVKQLIFAKNAVLIADIPKITKELDRQNAIRDKVVRLVTKSGKRD